MHAIIVAIWGRPQHTFQWQLSTQGCSTTRRDKPRHRYKQHRCTNCGTTTRRVAPQGPFVFPHQLQSQRIFVATIGGQIQPVPRPRRTRKCRGVFFQKERQERQEHQFCLLGTPRRTPHGPRTTMVLRRGKPGLGGTRPSIGVIRRGGSTDHCHRALHAVLELRRTRATTVATHRRRQVRGAVQHEIHPHLDCIFVVVPRRRGDTICPRHYECTTNSAGVLLTVPREIVDLSPRHAPRRGRDRYITEIVVAG